MAIIKYRVEAAVTHTDADYDQNVIESTWQYEEVFDPEKDGKLLSREEALRLIKEKGMIQVYTSPFGSVYDTPDEPFWEKYNGYYSQHKRRNRKS